MMGTLLFLGAVALLIWLSSFTKWPYLWAASFFKSCPKCGEAMLLREPVDLLRGIPHRHTVIFRCPKCSEEIRQKEWRLK